MFARIEEVVVVVCTDLIPACVSQSWWRFRKNSCGVDEIVLNCVVCVCPISTSRSLQRLIDGQPEEKCEKKQVEVALANVHPSFSSVEKELRIGRYPVTVRVSHF